MPHLRDLGADVMMVAGDHSTPAQMRGAQLAPGAVPALKSKLRHGRQRRRSSTKPPAAHGVAGHLPGQGGALAGDGARGPPDEVRSLMYAADADRRRQLEDEHDAATARALVEGIKAGRRRRDAGASRRCSARPSSICRSSPRSREGHVDLRSGRRTCTGRRRAPSRAKSAPRCCKDFATHVIIGHSERAPVLRRYGRERATGSCAAALDARPDADRLRRRDGSRSAHAGKTQDVLRTQVNGALD